MSPSVGEANRSSKGVSVSNLTERELDERVRTHLPLVGHIVRETLGRVPAHVGRDELTSAGMYALAAAAKSFDPSHGVSFGNYAAIRIRGAIADELRGRDWASRSVRGKARAAEQARNELTVALRRTPTRDEIARAMGVTASELDDIDADVARAGVLSLQALTPEDSDMLVPATSKQPEALLLDRERLGYLHDAIAELPERLRTVVVGYFFDQRKMLDIAAELGVTESRVSQLRSEALVMLRAGMKAADAVESAPAAAEPAPELSPRARAKEASKAAYFAAVATRSSVASRLDATSVLGEPRAMAAAPARF